MYNLCASNQIHKEEDTMAAKSSRHVTSDDEYDADDEQYGDEEPDKNKDGLQSDDIDEQRQFNAFICSKIDQTWVSAI